MNEEIKIDKDVPLPKMRGKHQAEREALGKMEVGDSIYVSLKTYCDAAVLNTRKHLPKRFFTRCEADGCRIWRYE